MPETGTAPLLKQATEQHIARFRAAITDPRNLAYYQADATIALIPLNDQGAIRSGLSVAQRAHRRQQKVQYLFTTEGNSIIAAGAQEFMLDLRDEIWGTEQRPSFDGATAEEVRVRLGSIVAARQIWDTADEVGEDIIILNGLRIYVVDEVADGVFSCVAPDIS